jgi:hypothetical protein
MVERDADIEAEIASLNEALSPSNADALKTFLTTQFAKSVQQIPLRPGMRPSWRATLPQQGSVQP